MTILILVGTLDKAPVGVADGDAGKRDIFAKHKNGVLDCLRMAEADVKLHAIDALGCFADLLAFISNDG